MIEKYLENYPLVLNVNEVASILGVNNNTVRRLIREKEISSIRIGRLIKVPKDKLISYLENQD